MRTETVKSLKQRERTFREVDIPFGEHVSLARSKWENRIELESVLRRLRINDAGAVLDVGCADGRFLEHLHKRFKQCKLYGIDFARNPLKKLKGKDFRTHLVCSDACEMPFKRMTVFFAVAIQVLQQIPTRDERIRTLREINDVLIPSGKFVLTVLNRKTWHHMVENGEEGPLITCKDLYVYLYNPSDLRSELEDGGFLVKKVVGVNNLPVRYLKTFSALGMLLDLLISDHITFLSLKKGTYLLAECVKG